MVVAYNSSDYNIYRANKMNDLKSSDLLILEHSFIIHTGYINIRSFDGSFQFS